VTWVHIQFGNEYDLNYSMYASYNHFNYSSYVYAFLSVHISLCIQVILILWNMSCFEYILWNENLFIFAYIMDWECHCFIHVGLNTSTLTYEDIACRLWSYIHTTLNRKKCQKKIDIHESQEKIRAHRASSKATRLFLTR